MPLCFSGTNCEALCCGSCNLSNDAALARFPAGKILSIRTTEDFMQLGVTRTDNVAVGELREVTIRRGIMYTTIQRG